MSGGRVSAKAGIFQGRTRFHVGMETRMGCLKLVSSKAAEKFQSGEYVADEMTKKIKEPP